MKKKFCYSTKNVLRDDDSVVAVCNVDYNDIEEAIACVSVLLDHLIDVNNEEL